MGWSASRFMLTGREENMSIHRLPTEVPLMMDIPVAGLSARL